MVETLFEDIFTVTNIDPDGKKFEKGIHLRTLSLTVLLCYLLVFYVHPPMLLEIFS